jgi:hypothetical protein
MKTEYTPSVTAGDNIVKLSTRRARKANPAERAVVEQYNETVRIANRIVWPKLSEPTDYPENNDDLAAMDFAAVPEFRSSGVGPGTAEFREQLEAHFDTIQVACRHAFAVLGFSRQELTDIAKSLAAPDEKDDGAMAIANIITCGFNDLMTLARYLRAAEVRQVVAIVLRDMEVEGSEPPPADTRETA